MILSLWVADKFEVPFHFDPPLEREEEKRKVAEWEREIAMWRTII